MALYPAYTIYCHGRFSQTVGKRIMGVRLVRVTGERVGWREAWLRSSVDVAFAGIYVTAIFIALINIPDSAYYGAKWSQRSRTLHAFEPIWLACSIRGSSIWTWSEG